jgi:hypothetical protein
MITQRWEDTGRTAPNAGALEAELELRIVRLEHLVAGLGLVFERFQGASPALGATVFDDFDDPGASNEALDVLFASSMDARRDLTVLRREVPAIVPAPDGRSALSLVARLGLLGERATELAGRFEQYRRSISLTGPPRTPGGIGRLDEFVALVVRALLDIADVTDGLRRDKGRLGLATSPATYPPEPATSPREGQRPSVGALGMPVARGLAGALWLGVRRRRTRLMAEFAAVAVVGMVVLVSALDQGGRPPGLVGGPGSASVGPGQTGAVAAGGSPTGSPAPGASTEPGASGTPPTPGGGSAAGAPPRSGPTNRPRPTLDPATAAAIRFNERITTAAGSIDDLVNTITTAVRDADVAVAKSAAEDIATIASTERSWLLAHPPAACYDSFQDAAFARYGELTDTATAIAHDADADDINAIHRDVASSHGDVSALKQAGSKAISACS